VCARSVSKRNGPIEKTSIFCCDINWEIDNYHLTDE